MVKRVIDFLDIHEADEILISVYCGDRSSVYQGSYESGRRASVGRIVTAVAEKKDDDWVVHIHSSVLQSVDEYLPEYYRKQA